MYLSLGVIILGIVIVFVITWDILHRYNYSQKRFIISLKKHFYVLAEDAALWLSQTDDLRERKGMIESENRKDMKAVAGLINALIEYSREVETNSWFAGVGEMEGLDYESFKRDIVNNPEYYKKNQNEK